MNTLNIVLDFCESSRAMVTTAIKLSTLFDYQIQLVHIIETPDESWDFWSRSSKLKHPDVMNNIKEARDQMNHFLADIRAHGIKAGKQIIHYCGSQEGVNDELPKGFIVGCKKYFSRAHESRITCMRALAENQDLPILEIEENFDIDKVKEVTLLSNFTELGAKTKAILLDWDEKLKFRLNLLFINTLSEFETSAISIQKMKEVINSSGLKNTRMTVFNAEDIVNGVESYVHMHNCDLLIVDQSRSFALDSGIETEIPLFLMR